MKSWASKQKGFTIVELLIVIVVIGIIAAIVMNSFGEAQKKARDADRKQDLAQIAKLLQVYSLENNGPMAGSSGCGSAGNGNGFFNYSDGSSYPKSMMQCLIDAGLTTTSIRDKSLSCGGLSCRTYMKYTCVQSGQRVTHVFANLETGTHDGTETDGTCGSSLDSGYGMNYFVRIVD